MASIFKKSLQRRLAQARGPRIALIADELTASCLAIETSVVNLTPSNYRWVLGFWRPDFLLVESAWAGVRNRWKNKIAAYPDKPEAGNEILSRVVDFARATGIPAVFWNKEDGVHFERFIDSASLFDHVFTVDENCIPKYKRILHSSAKVGTLTFPVQHRMHNFTGFGFKRFEANFVGSYSRDIHDRRRSWQHLMFDACHTAEVPITVYDRNSKKGLSSYQFPPDLRIDLKGSVPHSETSKIYKDFLISLNVNTVDDSPSMYSRRLVEILACGGIAITNPAPSVERFFADYCYIVYSSSEMIELLKRLRHGASSQDLERAAAGADYVRREFTWEKRLAEITRSLNI
jgi:spore maturation protein CgeB